MTINSSIVAQLQQGFEGAIVVVIGGSGGIGAQVVRQASELGAQVIVGSRSVDRDKLPEGASDALAIDIADAASIKQFAAVIGEKYGRVDVLVNTAGYSYQLPPNRLDLLSDQIIDEVMQVNARGPLIVIREMAELLQQGNNPVLINLSSITAQTGGGSNIAYAASKAGIDTASKAVARALAPKVRVVNISPSALDTGFARNRGENFIDNTIKASALKRLASLEEVATAVICAARLLTATTGTTLYVDAGRHL
ncbi:SDR family oxidoreductase [Pseudomaricurvus alkylphenolicus]|uniref:SDR family NAD(P)-dependent oxidoreductase n=1 Tax=Pseudomaricurvus alkylphenolicus TaxID=1306991 RepID=UPI0014231681|nr:SDR family oxidoreductase [Pseudomaricurvus alkylphenolicus]NIB42476.1 SDR family oxidoreductase [Pseudomaricurvus alkylphenolicus]